MTSLPIPAAWTDTYADTPNSGLAKLNIVSRGPEPEQFLLQAFHSFTKVAASLEQSYGSLQAEVERLRRELREKDSDLARSIQARHDVRVRLREILEGLPCGVLVVSDGGDISDANPEALRLLEADGLKGLRPITALSPAICNLLISARQPGAEPEIEFSSQPGNPRWIAARCAHLTDDASVFILRDVTERKRLELSQAKLQREVALAEMAAILAHEIRNPLGSLELFAGLLAESGLEGERRNWIEHVQAGLRTLGATVNNVLHFHSLPAPQIAAFDAGQLLAWVSDFCAPVAHQSGVTLSLQNRISQVALSADRHRLEQVLLNLVLNAIRAAGCEGWIEISGRTTEQGQKVEISVADTGSGIPPEHLGRVFEAGFSTRTGGAGLGLAVCRKIVEQHGGTISAQNRPSGGAVFTVTLPLSANLKSEVRA